MPNKVFINEQGIIEQVYEGSQTFQSVQDVIVETNKLINGKESLIMTDVSNITQTTTGARASAVNFMKESNYKKLALFGKNYFLRNLASMIIRASGEGNKNKVFETKEKAIEWLKKQ